MLNYSLNLNIEGDKNFIITGRAAKCSVLPLNSLDLVTRPGLSVKKEGTFNALKSLNQSWSFLTKLNENLKTFLFVQYCTKVLSKHHHIWICLMLIAHCLNYVLPGDDPPQLSLLLLHYASPAYSLPQSQFNHLQDLYLSRM